MSADLSPSIRAGNGLTLAVVNAGRAISAAGRTKTWRHPWFTQPAWTGKRWMASVKAGFVNDEPPVFRIPVRERNQDFGINPLTGKPFFSASVFSQPSDELKIVDVPITLNPAIPLSFRNVGWDGIAGEAVPKFFQNRGAANRPLPPGADETDVDALAAALAAPAPAAPRGLRLLRAADVILHQPRLALTSQVFIEPGLVTGQSHVVQILGVAPEVPNDVLRVFAGTYQPPAQAGIDGLRQDYTEQPWDELLISTIYLLSPPNTPPGTDPDGRWQAYVKHGLFWNLSYQPATPRLPTINPNIGFIPPLAGGAAQIVINYLTSAISDMLNDALNLVTGQTLAGTFWTPTGGGHRAVLETEIVSPKAGIGLDKGAQLRAQALAKRAAIQAETLDPAYPFEAVAFDPKLLAA